MHLSRITARGRITIPKRLRDRLGLKEGDVIAFEIEGDRLVARKVASGRDNYLHGLSETMGEWDSPEDDDTWRAL